MTTRVQGFQTPKNGSTSEECQDAVAWDEQKAIFAVADGVSDSAFQSLWANLLVNSFVAEARTLQSFTKAWLANWLRAQQSEWNRRVNWETIPWHGRLKAQQTGAQATFLGVRLLPEKHSWVGIVIGDCNLFRFGRDGLLKESMPNTRAAAFSNATQAFSSTSQNQDQMLSQVKFIQGALDPGDSLVLATDAMASWMLERLEAKRDPLQELPGSDEPGVFSEWVNTRRRSGQIKDDDTSLLLIHTEPSPVVGRPPAPRPAVTPPQPRRTSRARAYVYATSLLLSLVAGIVLGASLHGLLDSKRLERDVQKPLLDLQQSLESGVSTRSDIGDGLLKLILTTEPRTDTAGTARTILCKHIPNDPACAPPTPTTTSKGESGSK